MAKKKNPEYWYVIVLTMHGPKFVTSTDNWERTARWDVDKAPMKMSKEDAQYLGMALTLNGNIAFPICITYELDYQPFYYEDGEFEWKEKENDNSAVS